jgi:hypothetical protein
MNRIGAEKEKEIALLELLDRLIDRGVMLKGDLTISIADVDLISVALDVVLASVERMRELESGR